MRVIPPRSWFATACAIGVTALLLAACGSSSNSSSNPAKSSSAPATSSTASTASTSSSAAAPTGAPIKLGMICSCSGPQAAQLAPMATVVKAWADSVNAAGGINGHPVSMTTMDDGSNPATALQDAKALVQQDHIIAMVGEFSLADAAFASYMTKEDIPVVGGISPEQSFLTSPDFYPSGSQLVLQTVGTIALAKTAGKTKLGVAYCSESPICAEVVPLAQGAGELSGVTVTPVKESSTAPSYAAPCLSLKSAGVNSLFVADNSSVVLRFEAGCAQQGYTPATVSETSVVTSAWLKDSTVNGALLSGYNALPFDASSPAIAQLQAGLNKYAPGLLAQQNYDVVGPWAGGQLFAAAAKAADIGPTSTGADVKKGLYMLKNETLGGLSAPLNFTPGKPAFVPCYFTSELMGGKFQALNNNQPTCLSAAEAAALVKALHL